MTTQYDLQVLRNIDLARTYYRVTGGYRCRPVMQRKMPLITINTAARLLQQGLCTYKDGRLRLSPKGRRLIYE